MAITDRKNKLVVVWIIVLSLPLVFFQNCGSTNGTPQSSDLLGAASALLVVPSKTQARVGEIITFAVEGGNPPYQLSKIAGHGSVDSSNLTFTGSAPGGLSHFAVLDNAGATGFATIEVATAITLNPAGGNFSAPSTVYVEIIGGIPPFTIQGGTISPENPRQIAVQGNSAGAQILNVSDNFDGITEEVYIFDSNLAVSHNNPTISANQSLDFWYSNVTGALNSNIISGAGSVSPIASSPNAYRFQSAPTPGVVVVRGTDAGGGVKDMNVKVRNNDGHMTYRGCGGSTTLHYLDITYIESEKKLLALLYRNGGIHLEQYQLSYPNNCTKDTSFGVDGVVISSGLNGNLLHRDSGGKIWVIGYRLEPGTTTFYKISVARYLPNGSPDNTWGGTGIVHTDVATNPLEYAFQPDGKLLIGGYKKDYVTNDSATVTRLTSAGVVDTTFGTNGVWTFNINSDYERLMGLAVMPDGKIALAIETNTIFSGYRYYFRRLNTNGTDNISFQTSAIGRSFGDITSRLEAQANGELLYITSGDILKLNTSGEITNNVAKSIGSYGNFLITDFGILLGGATLDSSSSPFRIAKLNSNFTLDTSWAESGFVNSTGSYYQRCNNINIFRVEANRYIAVCSFLYGGINIEGFYGN